MRILHLVGRSHRRGAEQVALELAEELDLLGHHDRLLAVSAGHEGEVTPGLRALVPQARQGPVLLARAAVGLRRDGRADPVDVVLAHGAAAALVAVAAWPRGGPKIVFQTILGLADQSFRGIQRRVWQVALRRIDGVVALTGSMGDELRGLGYRGPVWAIPNGRRTERFDGLDRADAAEQIRKEVDVGPEVALIGLVGYLVAQKRPTRAVEVLAEVRRAGVDAHLVVAGAGPLATAVEDAAARLDVAPHVTLLGHRDDVEIVLGALDVLILTSDDEGIPGVVVEAAMAGCPVVSYPLGDVAEVIDDGVTGVVLDRADPAAMAAVVVRLLRDPPVLAEMSRAARRRGADFALSALALRYEERLRDTVG